jgi:hypothetical protein
LSEIIFISLVDHDILLLLEGLFNLDVTERERFGILTESSASTTTEDILQPLFQILLSE